MPIDANALVVSVYGSSQNVVSQGVRVQQVVDSDGLGLVDFSVDGRAVGWDYNSATDTVSLVATNGTSALLSRVGDYWRWTVGPDDLGTASSAPGASATRTCSVVVERTAGADPVTNPPMRWSSRLFPVTLERQAGFSPDSIAGLELWLDAYSLVGLADAVTVGNWDDQSLYDRDVSEGTNIPSKRSDGTGRPYVLFNGTNHVLATNWAQFRAPTTVFVAGQIDSYDGTVRGIVQVGGTNGVRIAFDNTNLKGVTGSDVANTSLPALDTPFVATATKVADGEVTIQRNLVAAVSQASTAAVTDGTVQIADTAADAVAAVAVYEVLVYNTVLSAADRAKVQRYLMAKWGAV